MNYFLKVHLCVHSIATTQKLYLSEERDDDELEQAIKQSRTQFDATDTALQNALQMSMNGKMIAFLMYS